MSASPALRTGLGSGLLLLSCLTLACNSSPPPKEPTTEEKHIMFLTRLWQAYHTDQHKVPANADELKAWAKRQKPEVLAKLGIEDVDKAFISPRDNEPYVVIKPSGNNRMGIGNIIYEKNGLNGKRMVATNMGNVGEMNEQDFRTNIPNAH